MSSSLEQLLAPLHPDEHALTPLFQTSVDHTMLREIAAADYGWKTEECLVHLQAMWKTGCRAPDDYNLREVLELIRWSEPADPTWSPGGHGTRGHWMRLFACTALVRQAEGRRGLVDSEYETLAQLVSSAIELGSPVAEAAASMLSWRFLAYPGDEPDGAFLSFAILLLAVQLGQREDRGPLLKSLVAWVEHEESSAARGLGATWLLGLAHNSLKEKQWRSMAHDILARPKRPHPPVARESLQLLGELVAGI